MSESSWLTSPLQKKGAKAEQEAKHFLLKQGLRFIDANYRCKWGEIDLIMADGDSLVFLEVRLRNNKHFGSGADSITRNKQAKLLRTAQHYLQAQGQAEATCRFDVISAEQDNDNNYHFQWIRNAFDGATR